MVTKICSKCHIEKPVTEFYPNRTRGKAYRRADCKACQKVKTQAYQQAHVEELRVKMRAYGLVNAEALRNARLVRDFHITLDRYVEMLEEQGGGCALCHKIPEIGRGLSIDHDHACCPETAKSCGKCIRGLLCGNCNQGLGRFMDDPDVLRAAVAYIERGRPVVIDVSGVSPAHEKHTRSRERRI